MTYVMSDIHGCYDKYQSMLAAIHFAADDTLYVLGDVLDRGPDGFRILLDLAVRPNVTGFLGNHELLAAAVLRTLRQGEDQFLAPAERKLMEEWLQNGGKSSILQFLQLSDEETEVVCAYLNALSPWKEVTVQGRQFVLVHAGLAHFSAGRSLEDYDLEDFLFCCPELDTVYFPDKTLVFGHTPTRTLSGENRILRRDTWLDIDCGCVFKGGRLGCLCLDTLEEFYV